MCQRLELKFNLFTLTITYAYVHDNIQVVLADGQNRKCLKNGFRRENDRSAKTPIVRTSLRI